MSSDVAPRSSRRPARIAGMVDVDDAAGVADVMGSVDAAEFGGSGIETNSPLASPAAGTSGTGSQGSASSRGSSSKPLTLSALTAKVTAGLERRANSQGFTMSEGWALTLADNAETIAANQALVNRTEPW